MKFLIDFTNTASQAEIDQYVVDNLCPIVHVFNSFNKCFLVESNSVPPVTALVESVVRDDDAPIQLLSFPQFSFATSDDDQWWKLASFVKADHGQTAQTFDRRGTNAVVYIVDSGVKADHPDLLSADVQSIYSFNADTQDHNGHGTAIASVISGASCGVTSAKIRSAKIFQDGVTTLQSHILAALDAVISDASATSDVSVVNLSWSIPKNTLIESKINVAIALGLVVVASAGNSGIPIENVTPASMPAVLTVGAYGQTFAPSNFSNYTGPISTSLGEVNNGALDIWAPGEGIKVALLNGGFGLISGTSISASIQSAAVAYSSQLFKLSTGFTESFIGDEQWRKTSIGNAGILNLTDVKYSASTNAVCAFYTPTAANIHYNPVQTFIVTSGQRIEKPLVISLEADAQSAVFSTPLPGGLTYEAGWLFGSPIITAPTLWEATLTFVDLAGASQSQLIKIAMLPDVPVESLNQQNPAVQIILAANQCGTEFDGFDEYYCGGAGCSGSNSCRNCVGGPSISKDPLDMQCSCQGIVTNSCF